MMHPGQIFAGMGLGLLALCAEPVSGARAEPAVASRHIEIIFSDRLTRSLPAIDRIERVREERFRASRTDNSADRRSVFRHVAARSPATLWAGERLIPDLADYSIESLLRALVAANLEHAMPDFEGTLTLEINRLKIAGHSLALLRGSNSYVIGKIALRGPDGEVLFEDRVSASLVVRPNLALDHQGPEFAFAETDESDRAGPTLSYFVEKALERAWPDRKAEIHGPVIIRLSDPGDYLADNARKILDNPAVTVGDRMNVQLLPR